MSATPLPTAPMLPGVDIEIWDTATKSWITRPTSYLAVNVKFRYSGQPTHTYLVTGKAVQALVFPVEVLS